MIIFHQNNEGDKKDCIATINSKSYFDLMVKLDGILITKDTIILIIT